MNTITNVLDRQAEAKAYFEFEISPTNEYSRIRERLSFFDGEVRARFPNIMWPYRFNESTPLVRERFLDLFPDNSDLNTWVSRTCFGEAPYVDLIFRMSYDKFDLLERFRANLVEHAKANSCISD